MLALVITIFVTVLLVAFKELVLTLDVAINVPTVMDPVFKLVNPNVPILAIVATIFATVMSVASI
jgi:hypothetical protein